MEDQECIHGLYPESTCTLCNGREKRERNEARRQAAEETRIFLARYEGQCGGCNLPILIGEQIAWRPDHPLRHVGCQ